MQVFEKVAAQHYRSDQGFEVLPGDRFSRVYKEAGQVMTVDVEFGSKASGQPCVTIWPGAFARWDNESAVLGNNEQKRIEHNFKAALEFAGLELLIWDPRTEEYLDTAVYHGRLTAN